MVVPRAMIVELGPGQKYDVDDMSSVETFWVMDAKWLLYRWLGVIHPSFIDWLRCAQ